jgi:hypothetical protein
MLYGAVHNGEHLFYEDKKVNPELQFSNVWQLKNKEKLVTHLVLTKHEMIILQIQFLIMMLQLKWLEQNKVPTLD